jgi:hypothetical protein
VLRPSASQHAFDEEDPMERGVYFDGWTPHTWNQHPSMPPRRLTMLDDLEDMGATVLVWAGLGGGSISLPYLEEEAYGPVPARFRHYGYVSESEFIAHARERDIDLFAIVFESQAWEFPAEVVAGEVVAQNELRDVAPRSTVGLREFSAGTGPASWKPLRHYFPDGLRNSAGQEVTDLFEEVACRDLEGAPIHAHWVEVSVRDQDCYYADRNNPVWREYLKAVIRIQIDAGARGIQLDETDTPLSAFRYGCCFCRDCVVEFRSYLRSLPAADVPAELEGVNLSTFDYRGWLLSRGHQARENPRTLPLYAAYSRCTQIAIARTFAEVADYAKEYGRSRGVDIRVGGNFYDLAPYWDPMVDHVDVLVTEMRETRYQQPWYFRHGVGLARGRDLVAVENPYGGVTGELTRKLQLGRAHDLFRLTIFEASAMGANMSLPYGSWFGTDERDAYWAPRELVNQTGQFLKEIDHLLSHTSPHRTAVVYSVRSLMDLTIDSDQFNDVDRWFPVYERPDAPPSSYWETVEALSRATRTFDVVVLPDEVLRPNDVDAAALRRYDLVVLPDVWGISPAQHAALVEYLDGGGRVVLQGVYGGELGDVAHALVDHPRTERSGSAEETVALVEPEVLADLGPSAAVSLQLAPAGGWALHVVNYDYDDELDEVRVRTDVEVRVRTEERFTHATVHAPGRPPVEVAVSQDVEGDVRLVLPALETYAVAHLR